LFFGNLSNEQVRRGEDSAVNFAESDLDDVDQSTTGRVDNRRDRLRWRIKPELSFQVRERTQVGTSFEYIDVDYNNEIPGEALDYTDARAELFVTRDLSEKSLFRLSGYVTRYESDEISNDSRGYGAWARYTRNSTDTFSWFVAGGVQSTDIEAGDNDEIDSTETSYTFSSGVTREWEVSRLQAAVERSVEPSGTGFLKTRDGFRVNLRHQFRPRWYGDLAVYAFTEDDVDDSLEVNNRDHIRVRAKLGWRLSTEWAIEGGYGYTYQDYNDEPGDADSNQIELGLTYRPIPKTWSR
jgi:hypothetical protein